MRKRLTAIATGVLLVLGAGSAVWAQHGNPPVATGPLPGGLGRLTASVESRGGAGSTGVDCPFATTTPPQPECYQSYKQTRTGSGGVADKAILSAIIGTNAVNGGTDVGAVHWGGITSSSAGTPTGNGRWWTGAKVDGLGSVSVAAGGGAAGPDGKPFGCVTLFAASEKSSLPDDPSDADTDAQVCGKVLG